MSTSSQTDTSSELGCPGLWRNEEDWTRLQVQFYSLTRMCSREWSIWSPILFVRIVDGLLVRFVPSLLAYWWSSHKGCHVADMSFNLNSDIRYGPIGPARPAPSTELYFLSWM
ncbi:hypothetical protein Mapa_012815 [Marchantia paleacea]|nr:hypothetical protein Mapa_012815 [Marchantia paleacea]